MHIWNDEELSLVIKQLKLLLQNLFYITIWVQVIVLAVR